MIGSSNNYKIYPNRERRFKTEYIVLVHMPNFEIKYQLLPEEMKRSNTKPSYYWDELVSQGVIESKYRNAVIVMIGEDYNLRNIEPRCIEHLSSKVLVPLVKRFKLSWDKIMYFDECLTEGFVNDDYDMTRRSKWSYVPMKNFDMVRVRNIYSVYDKYMDK